MWIQIGNLLSGYQFQVNPRQVLGQDDECNAMYFKLWDFDRVEYKFTYMQFSQLAS